MSYKLLRRTILPDPTNPGGLVATEMYFDTVTRTRYPTQFATQLNNPEELAKDAEVYRYEYAPGKLRVVYYNGNGSVYTKNLKVPITGAGTPLAIKLLPTLVGATDENARDACFDLTGQYGVAPYQLEVKGAAGNATGYYQTAVSQLEIYPVRFYNLPTGDYFLKVTDATGDVRQRGLSIRVSAYGYPRGTILADQSFAGRLYRRWWLMNELRVELRNYSLSQGSGDFAQPYGTLVDAYLLPGSNGTIWRQVYADGRSSVFDADVYFVDSSTAATSTLELENIALFNPTSEAEQNGGCLLEMRASAPPLTFTLNGVTNSHGSFDGLPVGEYAVLVTDSVGTTLTVTFNLIQPYALHWQLDFSDLDSVPCRLEMWERDYDGAVEDIIGQGDPVSIRSDGLNGAVGGQGDVPPIVAHSCLLNLRVRPGELEHIVIGDDRLCRVDVYRAGKLQFRGYVQPAQYEGELQDGLIEVSITATDGLAALKDKDFAGYDGQRLINYRPVLNTLLYCLSHCAVSLPVRIFTNSRDVAMASLDAPEVASATNRTGYYDQEKDEPANCYTVVNALAQALRGTLMQRAGIWEIRSVLESATDTEGRAYLPAGSPQQAVVAPAPTAIISPPRANGLHWLKSEQAQTKTIRAGWKSLAGTTDTGWLKNAYPAGDVFSDKFAWLDDLSQLRPINGWVAPPGSAFPLILVRAGEKGGELATQWPRSAALSERDGRYLQGPTLPLVGGLEATPAFLSFTGKLVPTETYLDYEQNAVASPTTAAKAYLPYELVIDGHPMGVQLAEVARATSATAKDTSFEIPLAPLPSGTQSATLRVYSWQAPDANALFNATAYSPFSDYKKGDVVRDDYFLGQNLFVARRDQSAYPSNQPPAVFLPPEEWAPLTATNQATGLLLISSIGVQLRPQGATWDGKDNFRAVGPGGNIRPTEPLDVYHADVPLPSGLFSGNLLAFGKTIANSDGTMTTSWSRSIDLAPSPLFESVVYDSLTLRAGASRLLTGALSHRGTEPIYLLDTLDAPTDVPGRRFCVGATDWSLKLCRTRVSLIENGAGADAPDPYQELPDGVRVTHGFYEYKPDFFAPVARGTHDGSLRVRG